MFFRKRTRVSEFLDGRVSDLLTGDGVFTLESFFEEYLKLYSESGLEGSSVNGEGKINLVIEKDLFTSLFIGTLLWLIKYRTLGNLLNSPRKMAYLDLTFDIATPEAVDNKFGRYDIKVIKETYDAMDINCKKAYTGELQREDQPRFLVSPLWASNPDPHPFRVAAELFIKTIEHQAAAGTSQALPSEAFIDALEKRFHEMTEKTAEVAKGLNIT